MFSQQVKKKRIEEELRNKHLLYVHLISLQKLQINLEKLIWIQMKLTKPDIFNLICITGGNCLLYNYILVLHKLVLYIKKFLRN